MILAQIALDHDTHAVLVVSPGLQALISAGIPLLVAFLTSARVPSLVKSLLMIVLNAVGTLVLTATQTNAAVVTWESFQQWMIGVGVSLLAYLLFWKNARLTSSPVTVVQADGTHVSVPGKLANVGLR